MTNSERREYNIQRTIAVALECFQQIGVDATTHVVLAEKVGLSTKTMQRYFKTKDSFMLLCMRNLNEQYYHVIKKRLENIDMDSMSGLECVLTFLSVHDAFFDKQNRMILLMFEMNMYLIRHGYTQHEIIKQASVIPVAKGYIYSSLKKGFDDGSIRKNVNLNLTYATLTSSFVGLLHEAMLMSDQYEGDFKDITKKGILDLFIQRVRVDLQPS